MNYLAHLALSGEHPELRLGGFLGDWLKGPLANHRTQWSDQVIAGVVLHRQIDRWIDQQPEVRHAIALLGKDYRRLAPPVIDITFDHFLALDFQRYHHQSLSQFAEQALSQLERHRHRMPDGAARFLGRARQYRLLEQYAQKATFFDVVNSLRHRISKPELLEGINQPLALRYPELEQIFHDVYPKLIAFAERQRPR